MNQSKEKLYKEISAVGYYTAKELMNTLKGEDIELYFILMAKDINLIYHIIKKYDKPIVPDAYSCFLEGMVEYMSLYRKDESESDYDDETLDTIIRKITSLIPVS